MTGHRTHRLKFAAAGLAAACLVLSATGQSLAQSAPSLGSWLAGPDGAGQSTLVGRIEAPRRGQTISSGANLLVSGWAVDTTAQGWSGVDGVSVYNGARDKGGTKLADGTVGLSRPDVADALGAQYVNSGFTAVLPGSVTNSLSGSTTLFVYLHTPGKGTWYKTTAVTPSAGQALAFPNDPIVVFLRPIDGEIISQKQRFNKYTTFGYALDRNPITDPNQQTLGAAQNGVSAVTIYIDTPPAQCTATVSPPCNLGTAGFGGIGVNNTTHAGPGAPTAYGSFSYVTRTYGRQYDNAGWGLATNPSIYAAEQQHTLYALARSSITGRTSTAQVTFFLKGGNKVIAP